MSNLVTFNVMQSFLQIIHLSVSFVYNKRGSTAHLNNEFTKIKNWVFKWKMSFNSDPSKQTQEVIFS